MHTPTHTRGNILIITIVFMGVFLLLFSSLLSYILTQYKWVDTKTNAEQALQIAEAGAEYYRWHLSHWPEDMQDGTGGPGPYIHIYEDPESGPIGEFALEIGGEVLCGQTQVVDATSTGWTYADPDNIRAVAVRIARPTVADYSYVVDSNVWAGDTRTIIGPYHSNGVVRMDGDNQSAVTSKIGTADCGPTGLGDCGGYWDDINGVYGTGSHPEWWRSAQPDIPFSNFDFDFDAMEATAIAEGIHLHKVSDDVSSFGYYLEIDGTNVHVYEVDSIWKSVESYTPGNQYLHFPELVGANIDIYRTEIAGSPFTIPPTCPLIYVSDRVWLEGNISGKVTVVANDTGAAQPDLFLQDDITYSTTTGADGLTVLAEQNLIIPLYVPDDMTINGIFFAQKGAYGRNYYECGGCTSVDPYDSYKERNSLTTRGTVVSKLRTGTSWTPAQGFATRNDLYDRNLAKSPPPMTPFTSPDFRFIEWREVEGAPVVAGGGGGSSITYVGGSTNENNSATSITGTIPAGTIANDFMLATVIRDAQGNNPGAWGTPAGWTQLYEALDTDGRDRRTSVYYKIHSGTESDPVFETNSIADNVSVMLHTYRGVDTTSPLDTPFVAVSHKSTGTNDAAPPNNSITTTTDGAWVILVHFATHDDITSSGAPTDYTLRNTVEGSTMDNRQQFVADREIANAGAENPGDWQHTDNQDPDVQEYTTVSITLRPAP